jgi:ATP-dependent Lon protease
LAGCKVTVTDEAIDLITHRYTKEAGVRNLERELASLCRKLAREKIRKRARTRFRVDRDKVAGYLGVPKYSHTMKQDSDAIGLVNGLAVTPHGGDLLVTEVTVVPGKGKLVLTGKLGNVMQESAQAALSYVRSRALSLGLELDFHQHVDLHVHCPEGAIPKDGPSAGIAIATAMVSALLRLPVRRDVSMTGEITLRGRVLAIGGLREKLLAAQRSEIPLVLIPQQNEKDLAEVPTHELSAVEAVAVSHMDEVLKRSLMLKDPESFLSQPSQTVDWRMARESPSSSSH